MKTTASLTIIFLWIWISISLWDSTQSAKILIHMGLASPSHRMCHQPLAEALVAKGHDVTYFSAFPAQKPHPKIKEISPKALREQLDASVTNMAKAALLRRVEDKHTDIIKENILGLLTGCLALTMMNEEYVEWARNSKFDLIIFEQSNNEIALGLAYKMGAKAIAFVPTAIHLSMDIENFGLPCESSWLPDWSLGSRYWFIPNHFVYVFNALWDYYEYQRDFLPQVDTALETIYGKGAVPPVKGLLKKVDLIFINDHFSVGWARALPPLFVSVAGMHVQESNGSLPKEIETFLEGNEFVYVSFGSLSKFSDFPEHLQKIFMDVMVSFQDIKFLLKWNGEDRKFPKNVFTRKWFPQQDLLANSWCKGFVTQGGVTSYQQAIYHQVPMLVIPTVADQALVARMAVHHKVGIYLELQDITKQTLTSGLNEILNNPTYQQNVRKASTLFKSRPLSPVETAVWWTEYVLKHDTAHLRSPGMEQAWWQRRLLDFWAVVFLATSATLAITVKTVRFLASHILCSRIKDGAHKFKRS